MSAWHPYHEGINLHVAGRITQEDAARQMATAKAILRRLIQQPGVVLADEVGMGKTFVSLAVAASVALSDPARRPVVVMVPPGLKSKWPRDFGTFLEQCVPAKLRGELRWASAETGVEFLKLLDDPPSTRKQLVFLTHGAMQRAMTDEWVRLAVIRQAVFRRRETKDIKRSLSRCLGQLVRGMGRVGRRNGNVWDPLLARHPSEWAAILKAEGILPPEEDNPVPKHLMKALERIRTDDVYDAVRSIPKRDSWTYDVRLSEARSKVAAAIADLWTECLHSMKLRLPLLILDEAHHLKNERTKLASLFFSEDSGEDSEAIRQKGSLGGVFERMLFLTATPFQLGHHELCSVVERFDGIDWQCAAAPRMARDQYLEALKELRARLDRSQAMALSMNACWGRLTAQDLVADDVSFSDPDEWWAAATRGIALTGRGREVIELFGRTKAAFEAAGDALRPWVIRHLRPKKFKVAESEVARRRPLVGAAIRDDDANVKHGLEVDGAALLPFLLAARATLCRPNERPVFAEGLASSYEAFLHTREKPAKALDEDDRGVDDDPGSARGRANWYLERLNSHLPLRSYEDSVKHPKIAATAERVVAAWQAGEKVVVFCHFVQTGYALRRAISGRIRAAIAAEAGRKLGLAPGAAFKEVEAIGRRFFDKDTAARREIGSQVTRLLAVHEVLVPEQETVQEVVRRFLRTPSFLVRFFPLADTKRLTAESIRTAFASRDSSGLHLTDLLSHFFEFLANRCSSQERADILSAVNSMQTGGITGRDTLRAFMPDEKVDRADALLPNVRLVNGQTQPDTRQRLMLTFNSPFFPEVLIASAVMAEGVDLHRYCRYVVHHDLSWNPSTMEQRTGRIDRIGAKVETAGKPIHLYKPFLAATQDERQFQVVSDRDRWFNIVMGAEYSDDVASTERQAKRIRLAAAIGDELAFRLNVSSDAEAQGHPVPNLDRG